MSFFDGKTECLIRTCGLLSCFTTLKIRKKFSFRINDLLSFITFYQKHYFCEHKSTSLGRIEGPSIFPWARCRSVKWGHWEWVDYSPSSFFIINLKPKKGLSFKFCQISIMALFMALFWKKIFSFFPGFQGTYQW